MMTENEQIFKPNTFGVAAFGLIVDILASFFLFYYVAKINFYSTVLVFFLIQIFLGYFTRFLYKNNYLIVKSDKIVYKTPFGGFKEFNFIDITRITINHSTVFGKQDAIGDIIFEYKTQGSKFIRTRLSNQQLDEIFSLVKDKVNTQLMK